MQKERLTGKLTRNNRPLEAYLAGLGLDEGTIRASMTFGNRLEADLARFQARRIKYHRARLTKRDAAVMLGHELAKLAKDGEL